MANQKATLHEIPLKTTELCLNKYEADIKPYQGFRKNNSPFFGDKLSPFNYKMVDATGDKYVGMEGTLYTLESGVLKVDGKTIIDYNTLGGSVVKNTYSSSGNTTYNNILSFFDAEYALCASSSNDLAIVDVTDGTIVLLIPNDVQYIPGEQCYFATSMERNAYCFSLGSLTVVIKANGTYWKSSNYHYIPPAGTGYSGGCCFKYSNNYFLVSGLGITGIKVVDISSDPITATNISAIDVYEGATLIKSITSSSHISSTLFMKNGVIVYGDNSVGDNDGTYYRTFTYGRISGVSSNTITTSVDNCFYYKCAGSAFTFSSTDHTENFRNGINGLAKVRHKTVTAAVGYDLRVCIKPTLMTTTIHTPSGSIKSDKGKIFTTYSTTPYTLQSAGSEELVYEFTGWTQNAYTIFLENYSCGNGMICPCIPIDSDRTYKGGICFDSFSPSSPSDSCFRLLFHDGTLQGVSFAMHPFMVGSNATAMTVIDDFYPITMEGDEYLAFHDDSNWNVVKKGTASDLKFSVANERYLIVNTKDYFNCLDTQTGKIRHGATDWNDRAVFSFVGTVDGEDYISWAKYVKKMQAISCISCQNAVERDGFVSTQYPTKTYLGRNATYYYYLPGGYTPDNEGIDLYEGSFDKAEGTPYIGSVVVKTNNQPFYQWIRTLTIKPYMSGSSYAYREEILLTPSLFAKYMYSYINSGMISDSGHTYMQDFANGVIPLLAMSFVSQLDSVSGMFTIQGMDYVITNGVISKYLQEEALSSCVSIGNMQLIGFTPLMAILWSDTNKTFYSFTGDRTLNSIMQADEINKVVSTSYNPNTMGIYLVTEDNIYIFTSEQLIRFELGNIRDEDTRKKLETVDLAYPTEEGLALRAQDAIFFISYQKKDGYISLPIKLTTSFYGRGSGVVSTNDTLYIRLFDEDKGEGKVLLKCTTLKEGSFSTEEKTFYVTREKWDDDTSTLFLRYQPKWQEATGISFDIESPFAIATLSISEKPETVQNSKYNI